MALLNEIDTILSNCHTEGYMFMGGDFNCTENYNLVLRMTCVIFGEFLMGMRENILGHREEKNYISMARLDRFYC